LSELEKLQRAKAYMDMLAGGVDPISGREVDGDSVLNNVRLSRCFFYVSDILRQVIENGGAVQKTAPKQSGLPPFALPEEARAKIEISSGTVMISHFAERINSLIDTDTMRKLKPTAFTAWLSENGYLYEETINDKKRKKPTATGIGIGISSEVREGQYGAYTATLYNENAQRFLVDHLDEIITISNS